MLLALMAQAVRGMEAEERAEVGAMNTEALTLACNDSGAEGYDRLAGGRV